MEIICNDCLVSKPEEAFSKQTKTKTGRQYKCKACNKIRWKKYYNEHKKVYLEKRILSKSKRIQAHRDHNNFKNREKKDWAIEYKGGKCAHCGGIFPRA